MKLYHAIENGKVTSSVQEDYDKLEGWSVGKEVILQEEVSRDNSVLKVVDGAVMIDEAFIAEREALNKRSQYKQLIQEKIIVNYTQGDEFEMSALGVQDKTDVLYIEYRERIATAIAEANTEVYGS